MRLVVPCPAKINLFLSVGPKDRRGYHPLRTIFQAIGLFDTLVVETGENEHQVHFDDPSIPEKNTVTRTLRLLGEIIDLPPLRVSVQKRIPSESGLGGGSSDAAGMIRAAQKIASLAIPPAELMGLAQVVGADVPFFLLGGKARAEGYGERLAVLPDSAAEWLVVTRPSVGCSTPEMFARLDDAPYEWREFPELDTLYNDFERVAPCESIDLIERLLAFGARDAGLTGSGSAVFGRFGNEAHASEAVEQLENEPPARAWAVRTLTRGESLAVNQ